MSLIVFGVCIVCALVGYFARGACDAAHDRELYEQGYADGQSGVER